MWKHQSLVTLKDVSVDELWDAHADIAHWAEWQDDIEWTEIEGEVKQGAIFYLKPKGGFKVMLKILSYNKPSQWTDVSYLPLAKMYATTRMHVSTEGIIVVLEVEIKGLLTFLWKSVIGNGLINSHAQQNEKMVEFIRKINEKK